jgi:hypothetical protein
VAAAAAGLRRYEARRPKGRAIFEEMYFPRRYLDGVVNNHDLSTELNVERWGVGHEATYFS